MRKIISFLIISLLFTSIAIALPNIVDSTLTREYKLGQEPNIDESNIRQTTNLYSVTYKIAKGWNIVPGSLFLSGARGGENSCAGNFKYGYLYDYNTGEQFGGKLKQILGSDTQSILLEFEDNEIDKKYYKLYEDWTHRTVNTVWLFSEKSCQISISEVLFPRRDYIFRQNEIKDIKNSRLFNGWNYFYIEYMKPGDKLADYFKNCNVKGVAVWDPNAQRWDKELTNAADSNNFLDSFIISEEHILYPLHIYVENGCTLSFTGKAEEHEYLIFKYLGDYEFPDTTQKAQNENNFIRYITYYRHPNQEEAIVYVNVFPSADEAQKALDDYKSGIANVCQFIERNERGITIFELSSCPNAIKEAFKSSVWRKDNLLVMIGEDKDLNDVTNAYIEKFS